MIVDYWNYVTIITRERKHSFGFKVYNYLYGTQLSSRTKDNLIKACRKVKN